MLTTYCAVDKFEKTSSSDEEDSEEENTNKSFSSDISFAFADECGLSKETDCDVDAKIL